ncbi:restriction endonuclease subunit S [Alkalibacterium thalassium]|uniref:Type I restriction enzyme, S subunit n=1 Tax=Alkalibacterium thalassium TaxID=426701 RepID=A0A1G9D3F0_9LACT|nr:restriction endonuclease subunit S [Alkalibacterium thalassium]SDK58185.1 type I restriction enzyme, S subunit [Alkalibacterium thalassium]
MSISEDKNVPELRFKGYTENWEQRKLGDISNKVTEKNKKKEFTETFTNSAEYGIVNQRDFFDKDISNEKNINGYYIVRENDFIYNPRISNFAPVGPIKRNKLGRTGVMSPLYYIFRVYNISEVYLEYYFNTTKWHKFMKLNGDSGARADRFAIKDSIFKLMPIPYPTFEEQQKIGAFLKKLDNTIALHQEKLSKLYALKEAYLQQMFPQYKENNPKVRFTNFGEKWQKSKLSEVLNVNSGRDYKHLKSGDVPVYGTGGYMLSVDQCLSDEDAIGIGRKGTIDKPQYLKSPFWTVDTLFYMKVKKGYDLLFVYSISQTVRWKKYDESTGVPSLSKTTINNITKTFPPYKEQVAIGKFFDKINELIDLEQIKLDKLKNLKKAYLRKMFI